METKRTNFALFQIEDIDDILEMYADKDTFKYIGPLAGLTRDQYIKRLHKKRKEITDSNGFHWISRDKTDNSLIGMLNLNQMAGSDRMFMGYQVRTRLWGQGYGIELAQKIVDIAFNDQAYTEIFALIESENIASRKILQRLNFEIFDKKEEDNLILETYRLAQKT